MCVSVYMCVCMREREREWKRMLAFVCIAVIYRDANELSALISIFYVKYYIYFVSISTFEIEKLLYLNIKFIVVDKIYIVAANCNDIYSILNIFIYIYICRSILTCMIAIKRSAFPFTRMSACLNVYLLTAIPITSLYETIHHALPYGL